MSSTYSKEKRVLGIDPTTRGFGFAIMEGPEKLIDWGVKGAKGSKNAKSLELVSCLVDQYQPDVIAVEDYSGKGSRRCKRVQKLINSIIKGGADKKVRVRNFSPLSVRRTFSETGIFTKHQIATAIAERLPELGPRLPPFRKCWMSEDYRMSIFDAVSFALTYFHIENKRRRII